MALARPESNRDRREEIRFSATFEDMGRWISSAVAESRMHLGPRQRTLASELLIFLVFLVLTSVMTWPWVTHLRDAASDPGDPYFISWILWWDYHQTLHSPLNLFHANIFFPYRYTLAFSEHHYGIALFCFPLLALGLRPLTVTGIATLVGFAFSGYGAFRLARTLTGSKGAAWVAGIVFAFIPYRFGQIPHLVYLFSGWIPLLLEALVLFIREPTRKRGTWLGLVFWMNALTSIHWFVLTLIPLGLSAMLLLSKNGGWNNRTLWRRALVAISVASVALLPFFIPYARVAQLYGFVRNPQEALFYSASPIDWLVGEYRNKIWYRLNESLRLVGEKALFPGLLPPLLALAAVFLIEPGQQEDAPGRASKKLLVLLDAAAIVCGILLITISGYGFFKLRVFGFYLFQTHETAWVGTALLLILVVRCLLAYPEVIKRPQQRNMFDSLRSDRRSDAFWLGVLWAVIGFAGSLGMNFFFHRFLYEHVPLFRSIRVPARWAMICYLGLALLAGLGAKQLQELVGRHWPRIQPGLIYAVLALAVLVEQRAAPLSLIHGAVDPDALTLWFKQTPMAGGIVELPTTTGKMDIYLYTLRAADHGRPLITAVSGFETPISIEIQSLTHQEVIPDKFIDLLESIPCSYLVMHNNAMGSANQLAIEALLARAIVAGRIRFIKSFEAGDLYAVTKVEPNTRSEGQPPFSIAAMETINSLPSTAPLNPIDDARSFVRAQYLDFLEREPDAAGWDFWSSEIRKCGTTANCLAEQRAKTAAAFFAEKEFQDTGTFIYRLYKATLGRAPNYQEFRTDRATLGGKPDPQAARRAFTESWVKRSQFTGLYPAGLTAEQLVGALLKNISVTSGINLDHLKQKLIVEASRARIVQTLAEDEAFKRNEYDRALVYLQYFSYLKRDPDAVGVSFWTEQIAKKHDGDYHQIVGSFIESQEYRSRFSSGTNRTAVHE